MADSLAPGVTAPFRLNKPLSPAPSLDGRAFSPLTPDECFSPSWLPLDSWGYRSATNGKGGKPKAHRLAYRLFVGLIPAGALVLHHCGNAACINPFTSTPATPCKTPMTDVCTAPTAGARTCRKPN